MWFAKASAIVTLAAVPLLAQESPAKLAYLYREEVQPGRVAAFVALEEEAARICAQAPCPNPYFAIQSMTGPTEAIWINGFDSFDAMEKVWRDYGANADLDSRLSSIPPRKIDLVLPSRTLLGRLREDLSFSGAAILGSAHFFSITEVHVRP